MKTWEGRVQFALAVLAAVSVFVGCLMEWVWALVFAGIFVLTLAVISWESISEADRSVALDFLVKAFFVGFFGSLAYTFFALAGQLIGGRHRTMGDSAGAAGLTLLGCLCLIATLAVLRTDKSDSRPGGGATG